MGENIGHAHVVRDTGKALLVQAEDFGELWVPKSVIHDDSEVWTAEPDGCEGDLVVFHWWAAKEQLI